MAKDLFNEAQQKAIVDSIKAAELNTSGEVQVHIENTCKKEVMDRATEVFKVLNMHKTKLRNGVLFYLAVKDKKFAILGDAGINALVPPNFWESIKDNMQSEFREGRFTEGLCEGIRKAGEQLRSHFPYQSDDVNELPDDISFSNN
ncbi:MAG TPA: TPM domain-containing protein [Cytophagaceae bacterium]|jgi:uncharacterized membrane protein|nr:TPM domain-containing protein [Cytophagaceae bacterium]